jgi:hypothetical protein
MSKLVVHTAATVRFYRCWNVVLIFVALLSNTVRSESRRALRLFVNRFGLGLIDARGHHFQQLL